MIAYPIKFAPILKEKVWGGRKLNTLFNKPSSQGSVGESWEISGVKDNISQVSNGVYQGKTLNELLKEHRELFLGKSHYNVFGDTFPLLIKFLDAKKDLSVQVHPDDAMAKKHHNSFGKTEMWYIIDHEEDAEIVLGLKETLDDLNVLSNITASNVNTVFNTEKVHKGDTYYIPAGKIHAIGAGVLAAEIQQTSDVTYRVYDWDRPDASGNLRELHTEQAIAATKKMPHKSRKDYAIGPNEEVDLVHCDYFTTNMMRISYCHTKDYSNLDSFVIFMCVEGTATIGVNGKTEVLQTGETVLVPACAKNVFFTSHNAKLLEVYI